MLWHPQEEKEKGVEMVEGREEGAQVDSARSVIPSFSWYPQFFQQAELAHSVVTCLLLSFMATNPGGARLKALDHQTITLFFFGGGGLSRGGLVFS